MLILNAKEIDALLAGRELELMRIVGRAYEAHSSGNSALPHSTFLRFPQNQRNRIIALPAYLGEEFEVAGIKWISSFPANIDRGIARASAVIILNSFETGRPEAILEGSIISAKRTAASAALAAQNLHRAGDDSATGLIGCGPINHEITRFLLATFPERRSFIIYDLDSDRARQFKEKCEEVFSGISAEVAGDIKTVINNSSLVSFATSAIEPYVSDIEGCNPGTTILHISLRDLAPEIILSCDNVVDDADHVCRAQTSVHLAEQKTGNRDFIRCALADILKGAAPARESRDKTTIFSPFGLGVLDLAVADSVHKIARQDRLGTSVESFFLDS